MVETQITEEEIKEIKGGMSDILKEIIEEAKEIKRVDCEKIPGLKPTIQNPDWEEGSDVSRFVEVPNYYQLEPSILIAKEKRILIADEMGLGKTLEDIASDLYLEQQLGRRVRCIKVVPNSMLERWEESFSEYCEDGASGKVVVLKDYTDAGIRDMEDADRIVVNYNVLSFNEKEAAEVGSRRKLRRIKEILADKNRLTKMTLDEGQNAKNPGVNAYRSMNVKAISDAAEYLCILSGTPIPNTLRDTYMLISLLMPETFPTAAHVREAYGRNPALIRSVLQSRSIRRESDQILKLPPIKEHFIKVIMNPDQERLYREILENNEIEGTYKLQQLRKVLLDPSLVDPKILDEGSRHLLQAASCVYEFFDRVVRGANRRGEKTVLYSPDFRRGVTEKLEQRYAAYKSARMDGTNREDRKKIRMGFQKGDTNVLVATSVAEEGINLNRGNIAGLLAEDFAPGKRQQKIYRHRRRGQKKPVHVFVPIIEGTISEGVREFLEIKQEAIDFVTKSGKPLTPEMRNAMNSNVPVDFKPLRRRLYTPEQEAHLYVHKMNYRMARSGDVASILRWAEKGGKKYAERSCVHWDSSYQANVARAYREIIEGLKEKHDVERKLDIGSGFGVLSHILGEKTTNVDLIKNHFEVEMSNPENRNVVGSMTSLPLADGRYDLAVCSLALHHTSNRKKGSVRVKAIEEAYRVLDDGGLYIATIPRTYVRPDTKIAEGFRQFGFEPIPELCGFVRSVEPEDLKMEAYVFVGRKTGHPQEKIDRKLLYLGIDDPINSKEKPKEKYYQRKRGVAERFEFFDYQTGIAEPLFQRIGRYLGRS